MLGALIFSLISGRLVAQSSECGTPDIPLAQMEQMLANLPTHPLIAGSSPWRIPIWFFLLRDATGQTIHPGYDIDQQIGQLNQYFDGIFEFSVCGTSIIDNNQFNLLDLDTSSPDKADLHNYVNNLYPTSKQCVKVFLCDELTLGILTPGGYTDNRIQFGENAAVYYRAASNPILGHELGHYFGLLHTYQDPPTQYVNSPVIINGELFTCLQIGDGICDTPADRSDCLENAACTIVTCASTDPAGVTYHPDPTLMMSYYWGCMNRFTEEQKQRMSTIYNFHPNYELIRNVTPLCAISKGKILRDCVALSAQFPAAFNGLKVTVKENVQSCNDFTLSSGTYKINPCNLGNDKRNILPDLNFSNPSNGVTTYDLVLIQKHILGIAPFTSPFTIIAADANNSGSVTTFDVLVTRKVILGIEPNFPENRSWRYIPKLFLGIPSFFNEFNDNDPFNAEIVDPFGGSSLPRTYLCNSSALPNNCTWMDHVTVVPNDPLAQSENTWSFIGVKVGDVNCEAISDMFEGPPPSGNSFASLTGVPIAIEQGSFKKIQVIASASQKVVAWQFGSIFPSSALHIGSIFSGNLATTFDPGNFHFFSGSGSEAGISHLNALWYSPVGSELEINNKVLFEFSIQADAPISALENILQLNASNTPFKFYNSLGEEIAVTLKLNATNIGGLEVDGNNERSDANLLLKNAVAMPNPFSRFVDFSFELKSDAGVKIRLFDIDGRLVATKSENLQQGLQEVRINGLDNYPAGIYSYSIESEGAIIKGKLIKN